MNRIKDIIEGQGVEAILKEVIDNIYVNGPVNVSDMETLSYIRCYHPQLFERYKQPILLAIGVFFKPSPEIPDTVKELILTNYKESIRDLFQKDYTPMQANLLQCVRANDVISFSAPTSTGKSHIFRLLISQAQNDVVVVVPSRALINEYYIKLSEAITDKSVNILTYVDLINQSHATRNVFIVTPERCCALFHLAGQLHVELFLFDEAQLGDEENVRGLLYDGLVRRARKHFPNAKYIFAHPFISNPDAQIIKNNLPTTNAISSAYRYKNIGQMFLFYSAKENKYYHFGIDTKVMGKNKVDCCFDPIQKTILSGGSVLIYMSKRNVSNYAFLKEYDRYVRMCPEIKSDLVDGTIEELKQYTGGTTASNSEFFSQFITLLRRGIVIHHGSMPLRTRAIVEQFVNNHMCRLCFSTSTLEQGINMPFDVVVLDRFENSKPLAVKNLIGRAGRSSVNNDFDIGYVVVSSSSNMSNLRHILLSDNYIKDQSSLDVRDALDEDFHEYKEAINNGTMDDRFNLPPAIINRLIEGDGSDEIKAVLDIVFNPDGQLITQDVYRQQKVEVISRIRDVYQRYLGRVLVEGEQNVFDTAINLMMIRLLYHPTFKQLCRMRYIYASKADLRHRLKLRNERTDHIKCNFVTGYSELPNKNLLKFPLFEYGTRAQDVSYDKILYDTYDYLDKLIDFNLGELFFSAFTSFAEKYNSVLAEMFAKLLRYGTDNPRYIWMVRYGMEFEDIKNLDEHIQSIDEQGIVFKDSIKNVPESKKRIVNRYIY
ncbi:MAG: DEAD/DEAH box helicase [Bacteroidales bacterium]|nr:DEAD/DEAH box helicase [Bacteroidales bacterium]